MENQIFDKINQVSVLANGVRLKILLALFNSDVFKFKKLGVNSHSFSELSNIVGVGGSDLSYHLDIMTSSNLINKFEKKKGFYHITEEGKDILKMFGVDSELVNEEGKKII